MIANELIDSGRLYDTSKLQQVRDRLSTVKKELRKEGQINMTLVDEQIKLEGYLNILEYWKKML